MKKIEGVKKGIILADLLIDEEDRERVAPYKWHRHGQGYISAWIGRTKVTLHRFIMRARPGQIIDHVNGDKTDCRKTNLRFCTKAQNSMNSKLHADNKSGYKGVSWCSRRRKWNAYITAEGRHIYLGQSDDPSELAERYRSAAERLFGEFARLR